MPKFKWVRGVPVGFFIVIGALAFVIALTLLLKLLISGNGHDWSPAIQASGTLTLVGVTGIYVFLTRKLVVAQEKQVRTSAQESAMRDLLVLLNRETLDLPAESAVPLDLSSWPNTDIERHAEVLGDLGWKLNAMGPLLPRDLYLRTARVTQKLLAAATSLQHLHLVCLKLESANLRTGNPWSVDEVRERWQRDLESGEPGLPNWEAMSTGVEIMEATRAADDLQLALVRALQE